MEGKYIKLPNVALKNCFDLIKRAFGWLLRDKQNKIRGKHFAGNPTIQSN